MRHNSETYGAKPWLIYVDKSSQKRNVWTYSEFVDAARRLSTLLTKNGVGRGDRVAIAGHNHPDTILAYFACWLLGACAVPLNMTEDDQRQTYIIDNRDKDDAHRQAYDWCFAKRPADELYDLKKDPDQLHNVAGKEGYADKLKQMSDQLTTELKAAGDPRHADGAGFDFDAEPYAGGAPKHPNAAPAPKKKNKGRKK